MAWAFSINIFLKDGEPEGLRIITQLNKTDVGVVFNGESRKDELRINEFGHQIHFQTKVRKDSPLVPFLNANI